MIEAKDILALCERFADRIPYRQLEVLRLRYNGQRYLSTISVGRIMGIANQNVQVLEQKGLKALQSLLSGERTALPIRYALSLWEPWATLWAAGVKRYETRSWSTPYRGELLIHASSYYDHELVSLSNEEPFDEIYRLRPFALLHQFPRRCIIGRCLLVDCVRSETVEDIPGKGWILGTYRPGRYARIAEQHELFDEPIPCQGFQKLFGVPDAVAASLPPRF